MSVYWLDQALDKCVDHNEHVDHSCIHHNYVIKFDTVYVEIFAVCNFRG